MIKTFMAIAVAAAFGLPLMAQASAAGDNIVIAQAGSGGDTGAAAAANSRAAFDRLDKNHDGFISRDEADNATELNTRFSELDRNNDGKLSPDEYNGLNAGAGK